jgi:hypothetical protein
MGDIPHDTDIMEGIVRRFILFGSVLLAFLALGLSGSPAHAQATRTWVSGVGDDANPCSRTAPCKTFAGAISKTAAGGEINCLDPGGFGALTITKAITIICGENGESGVLVSGTNGITVAAGPTDRVVLQGLDFQGLGSGINGINITSGAEVDIIRCTIQAFTGNGVNVTSSTANTTVIIKGSFIAFNGGGLNVQGNGVANVASLVDTLVESNTTFAVQASSSNVIGLVRSILNGSPAGIKNLGGATIVSFGPSNIIGGSGAVTSTINYQ